MKTQSLITLLGFAAPLVAQQPAKPGMQHEMMPGMMHMQQMQEMMGPMMRRMAFTPDHLVSRKDSLGLTADQVSRLTALRDAAKATHDRAAAEGKAHMEALGKVFAAAAPDTAAVRRHFQAAHQAMGDAHGAMLRAAAQARAVLTDSQRRRVDAWADAMQMMMQQRWPTGDPTHHPPHGPPRS
jgi:hypothetical protein